MKLFKLFIALFCVSMLAVSCGKKGQEYYDYTFKNNSPVKMNVKIYKSFNDYSEKKNPYLSYTVEPGNDLVLSGTSFQAKMKYYVDWYSDDFTYGNWFNKQYIKSFFTTEFFADKQNSFESLNTIRDAARLMILDGDGTQSTWQATNGFVYRDDGASLGQEIYWPDMNENQRYRQFLFNKNFTGMFYYKSQFTGTLNAMNFLFRTPNWGAPTNTNIDTLYIYSGNDMDSLGIATYQFSLPENGGKPTVSDTLHIALGDKGSYTLIRKDVQR